MTVLGDRVSRYVKNLLVRELLACPPYATPFQIFQFSVI